MEYSDTGKFRRELITLAIPLALQNLLTALVGASDALMLGRLTQDAIAAVSLANQVAFVMSLFMSSVTGSAGILIAQYWGKKDYIGARRFLGLAMRLSAAISLIFFLATVLVPEGIMRLFTPEPELIRIGAEYLRVVGFSYLFMGFANSYLVIMKISGHARVSVWISAMTVVVDMVADFFLIYGFGPIPALGAVGSAYSTVVVEALALLVCFLWSIREKETSLRLSELTYFSRAYEKDLWSVIPGLLAGSLAWGLSITAHSFIMGHMGTDATAAASVTAVSQEMLQCVSLGVASASGILLGKLLGQDRFEEAKLCGDRFFRISAICGLINVLLIAAVGPLFCLFYVLEPNAKDYLVRMLIFSAFYQFALAYNAIFTCGVFPAGGDTKYDAVSVTIATWCCALPLALIACFVLKLPVMAVYCIMCMDEIVKFPFIRRHYNKGIWLKNLTRENG